MAYVNNVITAPVLVKPDVQNALGTTETNIGALCSHTKINKWSKYKPLNYEGATVGDKMDENNNYKKRNCGFQMNAKALSDFPNNKDGQWNYVFKGVPYRLGDFNKYCSSATSMFNAFSCDRTDKTYIAGESITLSFDIKTNTSNTEVRLTDFSGSTRTFDKHSRGAVLVCTSSSTVVSLPPNRIKTSGSGSSMSITASESAQLLAGQNAITKYKFFPVLTNSDISLASSTTQNIITMGDLAPLEITILPNMVSAIPERLMFQSGASYNNFNFEIAISNQSTKTVHFSKVKITDGGVYYPSGSRAITYDNFDTTSIYTTPISISQGSTWTNCSNNTVLSRGTVILKWNDNYPDTYYYSTLPEGSYLLFNITCEYHNDGESTTQSTQALWTETVVIK